MPCEGQCPKCYDNVRCRGNWKGHARYKAPRKKRGWSMARAKQKRASGPVGTPDGIPWRDATFEGKHPFLAGFLAETKWEDGTARETGTVLVFCDDGVLKCCLNDRDQKRVCFLTASTWDGLVGKVEEGLEEGTHEWRAKK